MPRPLVFGNGSLFAGIDSRYRIRDLYYPQVGLYNHLSGHAIRMGVWVAGEFAWADDEGWNRELAYEPGTLVGRSRLSHPAYGIELDCTDCCSPGLPLFTRRVRLRSTHPGDREIRLFFTQDLRIAETDIGDTAFYFPEMDGVVHYKGRHWFLFGAEGPEGGIFEYATGIKDFAGMEGTWRDAEDGRLGMNPIAQGSVDSTFSLRMGHGEEAEALYWIACGASLDELEAEFEAMRSRDFPSAEGEARLVSRTVVEPLDATFEGLPEDLLELCRASLLVIRAHCDRGGAILAALDSDIMATNRANYAYCWPRDGAHVASVLDRLGLHEPSRGFFLFCGNLLSKRHPLLLQKYRADGTLGASWHPWIVDGRPETPFQEDESASVLHALARHVRHTGGMELLENLYPKLVLPMADFIARHRDAATGLPLPSYDLWEERRGVHSYTCACVIAGLEGAAQLAELAADDARAVEYRQAAREVRDGIFAHLWDDRAGIFRARLGDGSHADSSTLFLALLGVLDPSDSRFERHRTTLADRLWVGTEVGGLARYEDDYYFRADPALTGNPWIISTLSLAQCAILGARTPKDLEGALEHLRWAARHSGPTGILPEQLDPHSGAPLSVSPLTWSHAEFLKTALDWVEKGRELEGEG